MENSTILDDFNNPEVRYGGFWERFGAAFIDGILLWIVSMVLSMFGIGLSLTDQMAMQNDPEAMGRAMNTMLIGMGSMVLVNWLYYAIQESGEAQATIGKRALGLRVTGTDGERISFLNATGRFFSKYISALILLIGYIMQPFTERKQALHDIIAGTLVVKNK